MLNIKDQYPNVGGAEIFAELDKYYFQDVTKFEFTLYHYDQIKPILEDDENAVDIDIDGLSYKEEGSKPKFLLSDTVEEKIVDNYSAKDNEKELQQFGTPGLSINNLMSSFNEKMMGAARVLHID